MEFIADGHGRYGSMEDCGVRNAEYLVDLVHMNKLSECREFCGMHSWQNGTRCRDGVKVLWSHSHLVWLFFRVPSLHALVSSRVWQQNFTIMCFPYPKCVNHSSFCTAHKKY